MRLLAAALILAAGVAAADFKPIYNGKDLSGWQMVGPGRFVIEDGLMKTEGGMGLLYYSKQKLGDCVVRVVFKTTGQRDNSGVVIRLPEPPPDPWFGVHNGYEVQIDGAGDDWHSTGAIYSLSKVTSRQQKSGGEWNTMEIEIRPAATRISVNGVLVNEFKEGQAVPPRQQWFEPVRGPRAPAGYIGLQNHDGNSKVYFKEISVKSLK